MSTDVKTGMVVGTAKPCAWSQVVGQTIAGGKILILVSLEYLGDGDVIEVAGVGGAILESLKNKLGRVGIELEMMREELAKLWEDLGEGLTLSVIVVRVEEKRLLVVGRGEVELYYMREGKLARIHEVSEDVAGVVGEIQEGDQFVLTTTQLVGAVGLKTIVSPMSDEVAMEQLAVQVHGQADSSLMAMMMGKVGGRTSEQANKRTYEHRNRIRNVEWGRMIEKVKGLGKRPMKIRQEQKKHNLFIGAVLIIMLVVGVSVGVVRRSKVVSEREFAKVESIVESKMSEAGSVADLNPERAKGLLAEARGELASYIATQEDEKYLMMANNLEAQLSQKEQEVFRQEEVEITTLTELKLLGINDSQIMTVDEEGSLVLVDKIGGKLVGVSTEDQSSWETKLDGLSQVRGLGVYDERGYILTPSGVEGVELLGGEQAREIEPDELWGEVSEISMFAGNAYILDTKQGEIWKYPRITDGFGARRRWLGAGISLDLSKVVDLEVDGDIWIVTSTGKLERYSLGVPVMFSMEGFPAKEAGRLANPTAVATTENNVYVLEAGASRVVVFEKESGRYEKQLVNEELKDGGEMVVVGSRGYVLLSDMIVWFEL